MIEQIINWWNVSDNLDKFMICVIVFALITLMAMICDAIFGDILRDKQKTITQKFKEGLIKK